MLSTEQAVRLERAEFQELIDYRETAFYLGYGEQEPDAGTEAELKRCAEALLAAMEPRYLFQTVRLLREENGSGREEKAGGEGQEKALSAQFADGSLILPGEAIRKHLGVSDYAVAACLTLGKGVDELIDRLQSESMLSALLTDALANAAVERLRLHFERRAAKETGWETGWLFGIGYDDLPLSMQRDFLRLMRAGERLGLHASDKLILSPLKSVTGFLNVKCGPGTGKSRCDGRCGACLRHEECRFFRGGR